MQVVYERCCGLDVQKQTVVACVIVPDAQGRPSKAVRTFGTTTGELRTLGDWLGEQGVSHVTLESTGVDWQPVWNLLEERFTLLLVNARHVKAVPGRKTDVRVRHEVVQVAIGPLEEGPNRVCCHSYPTVACDGSHPVVRSPRDNVASLRRAVLEP